MATMPALAMADLGARIQGEVTTASDVRYALSRDFGGILRKVPGLVVRPVCAEDVAATIEFARENGLNVSARGGGHSLSGQSLSDAGIVLDMRSLRGSVRIDRDALTFEADAGVVWHDLAATTLAAGLLPPVLTGTLRTTVGGTHSVGGMGHASFRHGTQLDNCLGLEVVTGTGEIVQCSATQHRELFEHVLGGLGQFGVITRVRGRLRRPKPMMRSYSLVYANRQQMLFDLAHLTGDSLVDRVGAYGVRHLGKWAYIIEGAVETEVGERSAIEQRLGELRCAHAHESDATPIAQFVLGDDTGPGNDPRNVVQGGSNPWIDALMPAAAVDPYFREALARLPASLLEQSTLLFWPIARGGASRPMFMTPQAEAIVLASIFPTVPTSEGLAAAALMSRVSERLVAFGGKRYLYGWLDFDAGGWEEHYGDRWTAILALKRRLDPDGVLNPTVFGNVPVVA